ncbi:conserved hypothetical protein [Arthrobacter sp. Hiyo4]|nr:conserved hypothetical protein [Arthrobacter sp. Hiyo4]
MATYYIETKLTKRAKFDPIPATQVARTPGPPRSPPAHQSAPPATARAPGQSSPASTARTTTYSAGLPTTHWNWTDNDRTLQVVLLIKYASARALLLTARRDALTPDQRALYGDSYKTMMSSLQRLTAAAGEPSKDVQEQVQDWILTRIETGVELPDPVTYQEAVDHYETTAAVKKLQVRDNAALIHRRASDTQPAVPPMGLEELLEEEDEDPEYRVEGLLPTGSRVVLSAPYKAGKSTLVGNLIRSLVDDEPFLGRYSVYPAERVLLIDNELDVRHLKRWLRDQGIVHTDRVDVLSLRGRVGSFDLLDPAKRAEWAAPVVVPTSLFSIVSAPSWMPWAWTSHGRPAASSSPLTPTSPRLAPRKLSSSTTWATAANGPAATHASRTGPTRRGS